MNELNKEALNEMVENNIEAAQEEIGYELSEEDLAKSRDIIAQLTKYYNIKDQKQEHNKKIKAQRRAKNKVQRNSRRINRK
ncbi:hypothetical protein [Klebsiella phage phiKp_21]|uniref:Uncharacterized protein n=1 Tax=Klebsiella phage vB_KleM_RaK2 TaxID=1147094 RepID=H6X3U9_9CAUD|nr:hypothetical protein F403_gp393 [Klebsiella phage vB_KleM_RaK2]YP_010843067.1 hypothetical protein ACQ27_gp183 [Klebsiella phage K64-1]QOE32555.1 hypothetical protein CPT_Muenster_383 [Klebsiella phage Muenster]UYL05037.1 hypothetical protein DIDNDMLP_00046 [Klebsiella phage KP13-7]BEH88128.1 hypothetical protein [Klebsiella phage phiKp_21]AFA44415.1 hypothetical protein RaK2_00142 [Klebsiella phage vB_KleM_RaK2]